ncbi:thioredoxin domain-containing protein 17-like [Atheta coriaria]|uniref:thioredoxin domain-containing protein 17-like n=1 Tax=Dalotia coriaria TaxID=877792 RepID=UPI0031F3E030
MPHQHHVAGYENFLQKMKEFQGNQEVYVYYGGSKDANGLSWCDDCVKAWPNIKSAVEKYLNPNAHFVYVEVGDRPTWKDMNCPFRLDKNTRLLQLPTLAKWLGPERLEGEQCEKFELLELLFGDE